jgi:hypothetical protein
VTSENKKNLNSLCIRRNTTIVIKKHGEKSEPCGELQNVSEKSETKADGTKAGLHDVLLVYY